MVNQEAPQGLHRLSKEYAVALYLAALGGSIIATIGDLLTNPKHHGRLCHRHLPSKNPLDNFYSLLLSHRQDYGVFHTLT